MGKLVLLGQGGCIWPKWLYSGKVVVLGQKLLSSDKSVVFGQIG